MSKIQVAVRIRPEPGGGNGAARSVSLNANNGIDLTVNQSKHEFHFDKVFGDRAGQAEVFRTSTQPIIADLLEGYNGCVLTYGQTGAGEVIQSILLNMKVTYNKLFDVFLLKVKLIL